MMNSCCTLLILCSVCSLRSSFLLMPRFWSFHHTLLICSYVFYLVISYVVLHFSYYVILTFSCLPLYLIQMSSSICFVVLLCHSNLSMVLCLTILLPMSHLFVFLRMVSKQNQYWREYQDNN